MMIFLWAAMVLAGQATDPRPIGHPATWITPSDFPEVHRPEARMSVRVRLAVDVEGRVAGCEVIERSRFAEVNQRSCRLMQLRARFHPARNAIGQAVPGRWTTTITWTLPD